MIGFYRTKPVRVILPVQSIKRFNAITEVVHVVDTFDANSIFFWEYARDADQMNTADATKQVSRGMRVEFVFLQHVFALKKSYVLYWQVDPVTITNAAVTAIAGPNLVDMGLKLNFDALTVTSSSIKLRSISHFIFQIFKNVDGVTVDLDVVSSRE